MEVKPTHTQRWALCYRKLSSTGRTQKKEEYVKKNRKHLRQNDTHESCKRRKTNSVCNVANLPAPMIRKVFSYLDEKTMSACIKNVCKSWRNLFLNEEQKESLLERAKVLDDVTTRYEAVVLLNETNANPLEKKFLNDLKVTLLEQLPAMKEPYINQITNEKTHKNLILIRKGNVIGGITFKPWPEKGFVEVVFCVVHGKYQIRGYGSFLMNHLKDYCKAEHIRYMLTFADEGAVNFFSKQGFSKHITVPAETRSCIKEYDNSYLMECKIDTHKEYLSKPRKKLPKKGDYNLRSSRVDKKKSDTYCVCNGPGYGFMLQCNGCDQWYHGKCCNITQSESNKFKYFYCLFCTKTSKFELREISLRKK